MITIIKNVRLLTGLLLAGSALTALAQPSMSRLIAAQRTAPPISRTQREVERLRAITQPGYYPRQYGLRAAAKAPTACSGACIILSTSLPVTLLSFTGERLDARQVRLDWRTSSETNNAYFALERSTNPAAGFEVVGRLNGQGTSNQPTDYQFIDPNINTSYTYYQLRQVDLDGTTSYSKIIAIKGVVSVLAVNVFPNPGEVRQISFQLSGVRAGESFAVALYDLQGRLVYQQANAAVHEDMLMQFPASVSLSPGTYVMRVQTGNQQATRSFIVRP